MKYSIREWKLWNENFLSQKRVFGTLRILPRRSSNVMKGDINTLPEFSFKNILPSANLLIEGNIILRFTHTKKNILFKINHKADLWSSHPRWKGNLPLQVQVYFLIFIFPFRMHSSGHLVLINLRDFEFFYSPSHYLTSID